MCATFAHFTRCEMVYRCIGLVRRVKIIFLPTRCRGFGLVLELGPQKCPKRAILELVDRFSGQGGRSSKMRPNIVRRPEQHRRTRKRLLHLFSDCPRSHTSPSVALSIRIIVPGAMVVECGAHRAFGRIFDDRPPWPENRSTSAKMALWGPFLGPKPRK